MKKILVLLLVLALTLIGTSAFAAISVTKHNLTFGSGNTTKATIDNVTLCGICHVPHGGQTSSTVPPLWGRRLAGTGAYTPNYWVYGGTVQGNAGVTAAGTVVSNPPGARSLTCLSCHDGQWGLGVLTQNGFDAAPPKAFDGNVNVPGGFGSNTDSALNPFAADFGFYQPVLGEDLRNDHPVGVEYLGSALGSDPGPGLKDPDAGGLSVTTGGRVYPLFGAGPVNGDGLVECSSCHNPHTSAQVKFLLHPASNLCQDCHATK